MAIVEAKMVSGWTVDQSLLKDLVKNETSQITRYEVDPKSKAVVLYFDSVSTRQLLIYIDREIILVRAYSPAQVHKNDVHVQYTRISGFSIELIFRVMVIQIELYRVCCLKLEDSTNDSCFSVGFEKDMLHSYD